MTTKNGSFFFLSLFFFVVLTRWSASLRMYLIFNVIFSKYIPICLTLLTIYNFIIERSSQLFFVTWTAYTVFRAANNTAVHIPYYNKYGFFFLAAIFEQWICILISLISKNIWINEGWAYMTTPSKKFWFKFPEIFLHIFFSLKSAESTAPGLNYSAHFLDWNNYYTVRFMVRNVAGNWYRLRGENILIDEDMKISQTFLPEIAEHTLKISFSFCRSAVWKFYREKIMLKRLEVQTGSSFPDWKSCLRD